MPRMARTDWGIAVLTLALVLIGLVMIYSASYSFPLLGWEDVTGPAHFFKRQIIFGAIGLVGMLLAWRIDYHYYRQRSVALIILGATLLLLTVTALLRSRWLLGGSVQPFEFAKIGAIVYIAVWLDSIGQNIRRVTLGLVPFALLLGVIAGLVVAQPDFSSTALLVATATTMFFVAGADSKQLLIMLGAGASTLLGVANIVPYMRKRIAIWPDPLSDPLKSGFQTVQGLVALNRGRWLGVGFTRSLQKLHLGRVPHTDYIFAIIAEEFGFIGALAIIALYALWVWRGFRIARSAADPFGRILAVGLVSWVAFQAALNVAVVTNSVPVTGTVLPFVSYGGSSLISLLTMVGILLNISRADHHRRQERGL